MGRKIQAELTNMCMVCRGDQVLVQRRSPEHGWSGITFPGGHVEPGESVTQSVVREVFEETGLRLRHPRLCGVKNWIEDDGSRYIVFLYKCDEFSGELRSSEEGEVFWADRDGLPGMNLSSGMEETFRVFFEEELSELCYCREDPENDWRIVLE
ncbi:8-oxo-dGTP diphosphatase [Acutalibacter sp. 1XD8-33]|uniref:8-oxo-dGTP diphosphatase n=1 Tax=Acutalibacter sp. 1XD8-33 TaxID=2320081 RepID=UPI000EA3F0D6|nr:8-oxo-dGTP diphosphatase [Acutalibacter sp. 1XD8-33]RKJ40108.1 8-oxo-dGTP diphosphatase [Acutalibacter sp. 1XD8-33]